MPDLASYKFDNHIAYKPQLIQKAHNWKVGIEIFLEGYHVRTAHRSTIAPMFFDNVGLYDRFRPHMRNIFPKKRIMELIDKDQKDWQIRANANILYFIFPNSLILVEPDDVPPGSPSFHAVLIMPCSLPISCCLLILIQKKRHAIGRRISIFSLMPLRKIFRWENRFKQDLIHAPIAI